MGDIRRVTQKQNHTVMDFIRRFQDANGLSPDGVIGPNTLRKIKEVYCIETDAQLANFVGQCHHETGGFRFLEENLNYSAEALIKTWPRRFNSENAVEYARKPERIANKVYADRMGNGNEESGDGWKYRGRGVIQITGKSNYRGFSSASGESYDIYPDRVSELFFEPAVWFFDENRLWSICTDVTTSTMRSLTRKINGGYHGLDDRIRQTQRFHKMLG
jgi:putative chitinase